MGPAKTLSIEAEAIGEPAPDRLLRFGEALFQSRLLSRDGSVSCSSCHVAGLGFSGDRPLAIGVAGYIGGRRAPSLLGLRTTKNLMWDGRAHDLQSQVSMPLESAEMAVRWPTILPRLQNDVVLKRLAINSGHRILERSDVIAALTAYVGSLEATSSRFDRFYYKGNQTALSQQESWGFRLFSRKARCASCHLIAGDVATFTDNSFHATGIGLVSGAYKDRGRGAITGNTADDGTFRTPSLRGVALRPYLMHDGSITSLRDAVEHYNRGVPELASSLDDRLVPLLLTHEEVDAVVAFLRALTPDGIDNAPSTK